MKTIVRQLLFCSLLSLPLLTLAAPQIDDNSLLPDPSALSGGLGASPDTVPDNTPQDLNILGASPNEDSDDDSVGDFAPEDNYFGSDLDAKNDLDTSYS
jgi:hypothetical protein